MLSLLDLYYLAFPTDILPLKCLVVTIYALEAAQTFMLTNTAFNMFAYGYGDLNALDTIGTTWMSIAVIGAICESHTRHRLSCPLAHVCPDSHHSGMHRTDVLRMEDHDDVWPTAVLCRYHNSAYFRRSGVVHAI